MGSSTRQRRQLFSRNELVTLAVSIVGALIGVGALATASITL